MILALAVCYDTWEGIHMDTCIKAYTDIPAGITYGNEMNVLCLKREIYVVFFS